ncbi:hypothetical protein [Chondromyces apiculatus]|uniref:hypothetical protein n=1 Tax=Chondromyces apiculatus TaxID=51 RepID=UPI0012DC0F2A|nr:hypothetical protein [Chondromyces apiculatus]
MFKPGWIFATMEEIAPVLDARVQEDGWIIEGYTEEAQRRRILAAAERIVLLETPFEICIERAVQRMEEQKKAPNRFTQEDCSYEDIMDKHLEFIAHYQETLHPGILRMIDEEFSATPRVVLDGRLSVEALCAIVKSLR